MTHTSGDAQSERHLNGRIAEQASVVDLRVERARHKAIAARRSAAASLRGSAESHERAAKMHDERAKGGLFDEDDEQNHARRHRRFAQDDRRIAERARHSAEQHMAECKVLPFRPPRP